ncbi:ribonuclease Z [Brevibacillus fulvus]|uniref:Ribonuclease Z n=1 Tax=Brevibacillus fulvus TaxID=1125967 RepID=A0A938XXZ6_9BACL|nr:ribonuclease Z [Brevibacillus fulvus]MBM7588516.1 ribonuclease Z [Brevibacillus fulvus]
MIITFLGTSSGAPTTKRNVSAIALQFIQTGKWWLFDCGEATQHQIMRSPLKVSHLEKIFITHLHGDHLYGLLGLLASRSLRGGAPDPVTLYGPPGIERYVEAVMSVSPVHLQYPFSIRVIEAGEIFADDEVTVICSPMKHRVPSFAYAVVEKERPGSFRADLAKQAGIPPGPLYGALKRGETVQLTDGTVIDGKQLVGPPQPGRKFVYSGDTVPCQAMVKLAEGADLLIHEATYADSDKWLAERSGHSTARQAALIAREAGVKQLILTHFSPRYDREEEHLLDELLAEAQREFPQTLLAADFFRYELKRSREKG